MTIPFEVPAQFMAKVLSGEYVRYGGIIKDAVTGQVIGHLKEAGSLGKSAQCYSNESNFSNFRSNSDWPVCASIASKYSINAEYYANPINS